MADVTNCVLINYFSAYILALISFQVRVIGREIIYHHAISVSQAQHAAATII